MSPGCTSGPFPSRLGPFIFFPDHPRSLGVPNFYLGFTLKNQSGPPLPLIITPTERGKPALLCELRAKQEFAKSSRFALYTKYTK